MPDLAELLRRLELNLDWGDLISGILPPLGNEAEEAAKAWLKKRGLSQVQFDAIWKKVSPAVQQMVRQRAAELVGKRVMPDGSIVDNPNAEWAITETTRGNLHDLAVSAVDEGWTIAELQHHIIGSEDFSPARALTIARTEKAYAQSHGEKQAAKGVGMSHKDWIASPNCCDVCQENADAGRIPIDDAFPSGDDCVPAHPNDECANGYYESDEDEEED